MPHKEATMWYCNLNGGGERDETNIRNLLIYGSTSISAPTTFRVITIFMDDCTFVQIKLHLPFLPIDINPVKSLDNHPLHLQQHKCWCHLQTYCFSCLYYHSNQSILQKEILALTLAKYQCSQTSSQMPLNHYPLSGLDLIYQFTVDLDQPTVWLKFSLKLAPGVFCNYCSLSEVFWNAYIPVYQNILKAK